MAECGELGVTGPDKLSAGELIACFALDGAGVEEEGIEPFADTRGVVEGGDGGEVEGLKGSDLIAERGKKLTRTELTVRRLTWVFEPSLSRAYLRTLERR